MKKSVSFCLLSILLVIFGLVPKVMNAQPCCLTLTNTDTSLDLFEQTTLRDPVRGRTDLYRIELENCNLPDTTKVSLEWRIYRDGVLIGNNLTDFAEVKFLTQYSRINGQYIGGSGNAPIASGTPQMINGEVKSYPGAVVQFPGLNIGPYSLDFFFLDFFQFTQNYLEIRWMQVGNYRIEVDLVQRLNGTPYPSFYWDPAQLRSIGGHQSIRGGVLATSTLKPLVRTEADVEICFDELPYVIGTPGNEIYIYGDTVIDVPFYSGECAVIDSIVHLTLTVQPEIFLPLVTNIEYCRNDVALPLTATITQPNVYLEWSLDGITYSTTAPVPVTTTAGIFPYYVRQALLTPDIYCSGDSTILYVTVYELPSNPLTTDTIEYCINSPALPLTAIADPGHTIQWSTDGVNYTTIAPVPQTTVAGVFYYYVRQMNNATGCVSTPAHTIRVFVYALPNVALVANPPSICIGQSSTLTAMGADFYVWNIGNPLFTGTDTTLTFNIPGTYSYSVIGTENHFNISCQNIAAVEVVVNPLPSVEFASYNACNGEVFRVEPLLTPGMNIVWDGGYTPIFDTVLVNTTNSPIVAEFPYTVGDFTTGCTARDTLTVMVGPSPLAVISPAADTLCAGTPFALLASDAAVYGVPNTSTFLWSTGETTNLLTRVETTGGIYNYTVTVTNSFGCHSYATATVTVNPLPQVSIISSVGDTVCYGENVTLTATGAYNFQWSANTGGGTSSQVTFLPSLLGNNRYSVTATDPITGCSTVEYFDLYVQPLPNVFVYSAPSAICYGESATLTIIPQDLNNYAYLWSTGETASSINVRPGMAGDIVYYVTITNTATGCQTVDSVTVTVNPLPEVTYDFDPAQDICSGTNLRIEADAGPDMIYNWINPVAFGPILYVTPINNDDVTVLYEYVLHAQNATTTCQIYDTVLISVRPLPQPRIVPSVEQICANEEAILGVDGVYASYTWSNGATTPTITVNQGGVYSVTVTDAAGCQGSANFNMMVNPLPVVTISTNRPGGMVCSGDDIQMTASGSGNVSYLWNYQNRTTPTFVTEPLINGTGTPITMDFTVTATDLTTGCVNVATSVVTINPLPDAAIVVGFPPGDRICLGDAVTLTAADNRDYTDPAVLSSFLWTPNTGYVNEMIISVQPLVTTTYGMTVTNSYGCSAATQATITVNPRPVVTILGNDTICEGTTVNILSTSGSNYSSYLWSTGETTPTINAVTAGDYVVTVDDPNGCVITSDTFRLVVNPQPVVNINFLEGNDTICVGGRVVMYAVSDPTFDYLWNTGDNTPAIRLALNAPGIYVYSVRVTDPVTGCFTDLVQTIHVFDNPVPSLAIMHSPSYPLCEDTEVMLWSNAVGNYLYTWSTGETTPTINVNLLTGGSYPFSLTVTDPVTGCQSVAYDTVVVNPVPVVQITGPDEVCVNSMVTLSANVAGGSDFTYLWSTGDTTPTITVDVYTTTIFTVIVTNESGCMQMAEKPVNVFPLPVAEISPEVANICIGDNVELTATPNPFYTYIWANGATTNATTVYPVTDSVFTVTVTDTRSGCQNVISAEVFVSPLPVIDFVFNPNDTVCSGSDILITAYSVGGGTNMMYTWSNGHVGPTLDTNITNPGLHVFSVTATDMLAGCTATNSTSVFVRDLPSPVIPGTDITACLGEAVTLRIPSVYNYDVVWFNGSTADSVTVQPAGTGVYQYTATISDINGCSSVVVFTVTVEGAPDVSFTYYQYGIPSGTMVCHNTDMQIIADAPGNNSYYWAYNNAPGHILNVRPVNTTSDIIMIDYAIEVISNTTGCVTYDTVSVTVLPAPIPVITTTTPVICQGNTAILDAGEFSSYIWSTGATTRTIAATLAGNYYVTVTDQNGCFADTVFTLTVNPAPFVSITPVDPVCPNTFVTIDAYYDNNYIYNWSNGRTTASFVTQPLQNATRDIYSYTYHLTVTDTVSNCSAQDSITVMVYPAPQAAVSQPSFSVCIGNQILLGGTDGNQPYADTSVVTYYTWADGTIRDTIEFVGTSYGDTVITMTATNSYGCSHQASAVIFVDSMLVPAIESDRGNFTICLNDDITLSVTSPYDSLQWSTGATTASITVAPVTTESYSVTVYRNACVGQNTVTVTVDMNAPVITGITGDTLICESETVNPFTVNVTGPVISYLWSDGSVTPTINAIYPGIYSVTVTNINGCSATASRSLAYAPAPAADLWVNANNTMYTGDSVLLCEGTPYSVQVTPEPNVIYTINGISDTIVYGVANATVTYYLYAMNTVTNCEAYDTLTVSPVNMTAITPSPAPVVTVCEGDIITLSFNPSNGEYAYDWEGFGIAGDITVSPVTDTIYRVTAIHLASGCTVEDSITVLVNPAPVAIAFTAGNDTVCEMSPVMLVAQGGVAYAWSGGLPSNDTVMAPTSTPGTYTYFVTVTNGIGCSAVASVSYTVVPSANVPQIEMNTLSNNICEQTIVTFTANVTPAIDNYYWDINGNLYAGDTVSYTFNIPGSYGVTLVANDIYGCNYNIDTIVSVHPNPSVEIVTNASAQGDTICEGSTVILRASGATYYNWSDGLGNADSVVLSGLTEGSYTYTVTGMDIYGCQGTDSILITVNPAINVTINEITPISVCGGENVILSAVGAASYNYIWNVNGVISTGDTVEITTPVVTSLQNQSYTMPFALVVEDGLGCQITIADSVGYYSLPVNDITVISPVNDTICGSDTVHLTVPYSPGYTYAWNYGTGTTNEFISNELAPGMHNIQVTITNSLGCTNDTSVTVYVFAAPDVTISTGTPCVVPFDLSVPSVPGYEYVWTGGNGIVENDTLYHVYTSDVVTLVVTDLASGCSSTLQHTVSMGNEPFIDIISDGLVVDEISAATGEVVTYDIVVNEQCVDRASKVTLDFTVYYNGQPIDSTMAAFIRNDASITYTFQNKDGDSPVYAAGTYDYTDKSSIGSIPGGEGTDLGPGYQLYITPNYFDWLYLHYLDNRHITVNFDYFILPGEYTIEYTLTAHELGDQFMTTYTVANDRVGGQNNSGDTTVLARRTIVLQIGGEILDPENQGPVGVRPQAEVTVFPNPVVSEMNLKVIGIEGSSVISIHDLNGRTLEQFDANVQNGQTIQHYLQSNYTDGIYIVRIINNATVVTDKFVIKK